MRRYKGLFNWYGEVFVLYTEAKCQNKAFNNFTVQLAKKLKRTRRSVMLYFLDENRDNYKIILRSKIKQR